MTLKHYFSRKIIVCALGLLAIILVVLSCFIIANHNKVESEPIKLMDCDAELFGPLLGGAEGGNENQNRKDVLRDCPDILYDLRFNDKDNNLDNDLKLIDSYMGQYYQIGYLKREPYENVPGGNYVTAMDAPLLAVCCQLAYERTGNSKYREDVKSLIKYFAVSPDNNGFMLKEDENSWWPLEYSWRDIDIDTAWYTYNGSLYGTLGMELVYKATGDKSLGRLLDNVYNSYKKHADGFYYKDRDWTWYSLNYTDGHKIINTSEKLFIETRALYALYKLTDQDFYNQEYQNRIEIWENIYPVYEVDSNHESYVAMFRAAAPHPYYIDIYPTKLELYDHSEKIIKVIKKNGREPEDSFIFEKISDGACSYKIYGKTSYANYTYLGGGNIIKVDESVFNNKKSSIDVKTIKLDGDAASYGNNLLLIDKEHASSSSAGVTYELSEPIIPDKNGYFLFRVGNTTEFEYGIMLSLIDENGNEINRYYPKLQKGENIILFNYLGFKGLDTKDISSIRSIQIRFSDNEQSTQTSKINISDLEYYKNPIETMKQLMENKYKDFWVIDN